jgi:hypothetical protein
MTGTSCCERIFIVSAAGNDRRSVVQILLKLDEGVADDGHASQFVRCVGDGVIFELNETRELQLGMTATPRRTENVDTYRYFGDPVYVYSLKEGINDGFLTPFKVKQFATTLDEYVYTPDDKIVEGEIEEGKRYREPQFIRSVII